MRTAEEKVSVALEAFDEILMLTSNNIRNAIKLLMADIEEQLDNITRDYNRSEKEIRYEVSGVLTDFVTLRNCLNLQIHNVENVMRIASDSKVSLIRK